MSEHPCGHASRGRDPAGAPLVGGAALWRRAEALGFDHAWTYDHLAWRSLRDSPWFGAVPTLTAAAMATERIRLGTLVASPNFRHPVPFATELVTLDDISGGRLTLGIGAGGDGWDATMLGQVAWSPRGAGPAASRSSSSSPTSAARAGGVVHGSLLLGGRGPHLSRMRAAPANPVRSGRHRAARDAAGGDLRRDMGHERRSLPGRRR